MAVRRLLVGFCALMSVLVMGLVFLPQPAHAASFTECQDNNSITILPKWYKYLNPQWGDPDGGGPAPEQCVLNATFPDALPAILLAVFEIILRIGGMVAVVFITYGGFQYLITTGEPDKAKNARTTIMNALVGLLITIFATTIVNLVGRNIG